MAEEQAAAGGAVEAVDAAEVEELAVAVVAEAPAVQAVVAVGSDADPEWRAGVGTAAGGRTGAETAVAVPVFTIVKLLQSD